MHSFLTIFTTVDLTPDMSSNDSNFGLIKTESLSITLGFGVALPHTVTVLLYAVFDVSFLQYYFQTKTNPNFMFLQNMLEITRTGDVIFDYQS